MFLSVEQLQDVLNKLGDSHIAAQSQRFFKTGEGEYGEGDVFIGIRLPILRSILKDCRQLTFDDVTQLLQIGRHEERLLAVLIMVDRFERAKNDADTQKKIVDWYLENIAYINNWDIVDASAYKIVGAWLRDKTDRSVIYELVQSNDLWHRRIAILTTFAFIKEHDFDDLIALAKLVLEDEEDLIHKASGWMLREMGKRDMAKLTDFLDQHYKVMPRTMLRYAIERIDSQRKKSYLE